MRAICKFKCFFRGRSTLPGESFELTPAEEKMDNVKSSFALTDEPKLATKPDASTIEELTAEEYRRRLTEAGVAFKARDDKATLKKLFDDNAAAQVHTGEPPKA
jgi:hypothetical protein